MVLHSWFLSFLHLQGQSTKDFRQHTVSFYLLRFPLTYKEVAEVPVLLCHKKLSTWCDQITVDFLLLWQLIWWAVWKLCLVLSSAVLQFPLLCFLITEFLSEPFFKINILSLAQEFLFPGRVLRVRYRSYQLVNSQTAVFAFLKTMIQDFASKWDKIKMSNTWCFPEIVQGSKSATRVGCLKVNTANCTLLVSKIWVLQHFTSYEIFYLYNICESSKASTTEMNYIFWAVNCMKVVLPVAKQNKQVVVVVDTNIL